MEFVCNYSLIRFLPYRDAGEFVNIGVALACGERDFLDFKIEPRRYARVSHFFPELETQIYLEGLRALRNECDRWRVAAAHLAQDRPSDGEEVLRHVFGELTRARESIFQFDMPRTVLTHNPVETLEQLFDHYVRRQLKKDEALGEKAMRNEIQQSLREIGVDKFYHSVHIGTPDYKVLFPFVMLENQSTDQLTLDIVDNAQRVIKPLNLNRDGSSEITQHGDKWRMHLERLRENGHFPQHILFPIQQPQDPRHITAANDVCFRLESLGAKTTLFSDAPQLREFAQPFSSR